MRPQVFKLAFTFTSWKHARVLVLPRRTSALFCDQLMSWLAVRMPFSCGRVDPRRLWHSALLAIKCGDGISGRGLALPGKTQNGTRPQLEVATNQV